MIKKAILLLHFFVICYMCLYAFVFKKSRWDYFYLLVVYCIIFQWTFYNGECMLAYYYKLADDPGYVAGANFNTDYELAFGDQFWFHPYTYLRNIAFLASVCIVSQRSHVPLFLYGSFFILFGGLIASSLWYTGCDPTFVQIQKAIQLLFMALGIAAALYAANYKEVENPFKEVEPIKKYRYNDPVTNLVTNLVANPVTDPDTVNV